MYRGTAEGKGIQNVGGMREKGEEGREENVVARIWK